MGRALTESWNGGEAITYVYNPVNRMIKSISSSNGTGKRFEYDELNRLQTRVDSIDNNNKFTASYSYLSTGEIGNVVLNSAVTMSYEYNTYGYVDQVRTNNQLVWDANSVNEYGIVNNFTLGNQAVTSIDYDSYGFVDEITTIKNGTYLQNRSYDFNNITGNLTSRMGLNSSGGSVTESFTYDDLNRLLTYTAGQDTLSVSYDGSGYGNITGKTDVGNYDYTGGVHNVTSVTEPTELMQNLPKQFIDYTKSGKVSCITDTLVTDEVRELNFIYGPDENRVKTLFTVDAAVVRTKYFALGQYEKETDSTGNVRELYYISGADGVVGVLQRMNEQDSIYYIHKDHLGSFDVITNPDGTVKERYNYDPWGRRRNPADWSYNNVPEEFFLDRGFTGHEHMDKFGLINMNGRVYDQVMAMFLSPDNFVQSPDLTQNFNRYTYCLNNPLKYVDPSGMTYFKLEGNDWVAFEYNPFTGVGVDFRIASGGGIALEGPSYEELKSNSGNGANGEYGLPGQSYGEGTNGPGVGGIYYDCVSHTFRLINNPKAGGFYIEANAFEAFNVGLVNNPAGQGGNTLPLLPNSDVYWTITGTSWLWGGTAALNDPHFKVDAASKAAGKFVGKITVGLNVAATAAEGYDLVTNWDHAGRGDVTKFGVDATLTTVTTILYFTGVGAPVAVILTGVQIANTLGAFDSIYESFNEPIHGGGGAW